MFDSHNILLLRTITLYIRFIINVKGESLTFLYESGFEGNF